MSNNLISAIKFFPEIKEKGNGWYLFVGLLAELSGPGVLAVLESCLTGDIYKRKALIRKAIPASLLWSKKTSSLVAKKLFKLSRNLDSYHKKESASVLLIEICSQLPPKERESILLNFLESPYTNNRKRAFNFLSKNWSSDYQKVVEDSWITYGDEQAVELLTERASLAFLIKNFEELNKYFLDVDYDFFLKLSRNKFYSRVIDHIPEILEKLKKDDPISFISIMKNNNRKLSPKWALEVYKKFSDSRFLARWYGEMGLWKDILKIDPSLVK